MDTAIDAPAQHADRRAVTLDRAPGGVGLGGAGGPDQLLEPTINDFSRGRQQLWDYRSLNLQLVFYDQTGTGRWRLTQSSEVRFESEFRRRLK